MRGSWNFAKSRRAGECAKLASALEDRRTNAEVAKKAEIRRAQIDREY